MPRKTPYTAQGIGRVPCAHCGKSSTAQWKICATGAYQGLCTECDIELNAIVIKFLNVSNADKIMNQYARRVNL